MNGSQSAQKITNIGELQDDHAFQAYLLEGVSRTFALTIPQLPDTLYHAVANAYLLCRIVDTIEDEVALSAEQKRRYCNEFISVVKKQLNSKKFAREVAPLLSEQTIPAEHELIREIPRVIRITHSFAPEQQAALANCVETMAGGMPEFQDKNLKNGLDTMAEMDRYCYYVAGCVGEMLTHLFCYYDSEIRQHKNTMLNLAISFGQGLQMTNILKDIWDDQKRDVCWLPQEIFTPYRFELRKLSPNNHGEDFQLGLLRLIEIAHQHLANALEYTLLIPARETGIRQFCLWALGMAVLTLKKISKNPGFDDSNQVKISRRNVKTTILATRISVKRDWMLKLLFDAASHGIKTPDQLPNTVAKPQ